MDVTIIQISWSLWHKFLPNTAAECLWIPSRHSPRKPGWKKKKNLHIAETASILLPSLFVVKYFLSGWDTTCFCTSTIAMGGTIVLDLQSSSCVHCQLFQTHTHTHIQACSIGPRGPAVRRGSPQPAARDNASGSQPWYMPPPAKLGQLACMPRVLPA